MAPSHSLFNSPRIPYHDHVPPTSPSLQMPNVFVVPPEEDQLSPWCCFDATEAPPLEPGYSTILDVEFLDGALGVLHTESHAPIFHRDAEGPFESRNPIIMPRKSIETRSITGVLMNDEYYDTDDELELEQDQDVQAPREGRRREAGEDSEIVEVVKVRRYSRNDEVPSNARAPAKNTKSFKSRASKAFQSLKNVGKGSTRSKRRAQDIFTSPPSTEDEPPPRAKTPTMSRRGSIILSQIFNNPATIKARPSVSSFEAPQSPSESIFPSSSSSSVLNQPPLPTLSHDSFSPPDFLNPSSSSPLLQWTDPQGFRSPSPTPSTQTSSARRRFSVISLQRIFSFSSSDPGVDATPRPTSMSRDSTGPSSASSLGPDTPTEELAPLPLPLPHSHQIYSETAKGNTMHSKAAAAGASIVSSGDVSFEMRLDSLHFESLSFDADRF
jgi:hypothetical protein